LFSLGGRGAGREKMRRPHRAVNTLGASLFQSAEDFL
jgi:hypothetical protein